MSFVLNRGAAGRMRRAGFTLLELLVVIVIIGLLAAYVGPKYFSQLGKSEVTVTRAQIEAFDKSLDTFRLDVGRYPSAAEGLGALVQRPGGLARWNGPYLQQNTVPLDPWGNAYAYAAEGPQSYNYECHALNWDCHYYSRSQHDAHYDNSQ